MSNSHLDVRNDRTQDERFDRVNRRRAWSGLGWLVAAAVLVIVGAAWAASTLRLPTGNLW